MTWEIEKCHNIYNLYWECSKFSTNCLKSVFPLFSFYLFILVSSVRLFGVKIWSYAFQIVAAFLLSLQ